MTYTPRTLPAGGRFFVTCAQKMENLLAQELTTLGARQATPGVSGVWVRGDLELAYRVCLWSRLASRVLWPLGQGQVREAEDLYQVVKAHPWSEEFDCDATFAVSFSGQGNGIRNTHFGALKFKDAVCDRFVDDHGRRPSVNTEQPAVRLYGHLYRGTLRYGIDLAGDSLHRRGYRPKAGAAPLKESLAAAVLLAADWPAIASAGGALNDPACGSGTLLIEGAMIALGIAPNLGREHFGFDHWLQHRPAQWKRLQEEAQTQRRQALAREQLPGFYGSDEDGRVLSLAQEAAARAGLGRVIHFRKQPLGQWQPQGMRGLVVTNPPYGERLSDLPVALQLYRKLGDVLRQQASGWQVAVLTAEGPLGKQLELTEVQERPFLNGPIRCTLLTGQAGTALPTRSEARPAASASGQDSEALPLSAGAQMVANRIRKNLKGLKRWIQQGASDAYRIYDADIPEYAAAVDRYGDWLHVAEYAAPAKIDEQQARIRLLDLLQALPEATGIAADRIVVKERRRQKGSSQYRKLASGGDRLVVREGQAQLLVNLTDYLDTGLFLDHRPLRLRIGEEARGKRFLNLFCYTATASVQAALGGAQETTSVDLSRTYLDWGRANFARNGLGETHNHFIQADCREWLKACRDRFDLILLDPPSFSNSKRMEGVLDVQRDHVELVKEAMRCLAPGGVLYFSNNFRRFKLDHDALSRYRVEEISTQTIDQDFQRNAKIHVCYRITHA